MDTYHHLAAKAGNFSTLCYLVNTFPATLLCIENSSGQTPLQVACANGHDSAATYLIRAHKQYTEAITPDRLAAIINMVKEKQLAKAQAELIKEGYAKAEQFA